PSMQLCIENVDQAGGCSYGYSCTYTDSISWASPKQPLPMVRDPRVVFDQLFGVGATPGERRERRVEDRSLLDWLTGSVARLQKELGTADRARLGDYLDNVREIERRIQKVEKYNSSGEPRDLPGAPIGVPDSFSEHVPLMFAGHAGGALKGGIHIKAADGTPMANAMLSIVHALGIDEPSFGDSTAAMDLNNAAPALTTDIA